ncbi:hypothetical protein AWB74_04035 [Caballeronia arvi]|uniref:Uncharacterized protein n=1 Tax=Caballeronia arvi TaxID=1777135 RepID=A0A158JMS2_9BURK|nr:hypothetical protein [Caballeronia arvi]SAL69773.1 hypothetical protein AWB74_04035 [Caballeronia arvi]
MESVELEESTEMRCTLYELSAYEADYLSMPRISELSNEERRKQRERDKQDFLEWFWLSPLAGGLAGEVGSEELDQLHEFARENQLHDARSRHLYKEVEDAIKEAVEDDLIIPVIDRTDDWCGGPTPALAPRAPSVSHGLMAESVDWFAPLSGTFGSEPILSGPYDPSKQEALLKAARLEGGGGGGGGGFDWLGPAEAAAGALLGGSRSYRDGYSNPLLKSFGDGDAKPFEYVPDAPGNEVLELAAKTNNPDYAAKMLGYDRDTFGDMIHAMKYNLDLRGDDNVIWHDSGDVEFRRRIIGNMHDYAN